MKHFNWSVLVDDIKEILVINQTQLAEKCEVTQESVSNWKTGVSKPGVYARHLLGELCQEAKLKIEDYRIERKQRKCVKRKVESETLLSEDILAFAGRLTKLSKRQRKKIMDMAEFMIERD